MCWIQSSFCTTPKAWPNSLRSSWTWVTRLLTCAFSSETSSCKSASSLLGRVIWFCGCGGCCACCTGCCGWLVLLLVLRLKKVRWIIRLRWISPRWVKVGKEQRYILRTWEIKTITIEEQCPIQNTYMVTDFALVNANAFCLLPCYLWSWWWFWSWSFFHHEKGNDLCFWSFSSGAQSGLLQ